MSHPDALRHFKEGLELLDSHCPETALARLKDALDLDPGNAFYISYMGLALAKAGGKIQDAEKLCDDALRRQGNRAELYLNLAEVYRLGGKKDDAIEILITGLRFTRQDARLGDALDKLGRRQPPVLAFLDRKNILNMKLGKIRYRLSNR